MISLQSDLRLSTAVKHIEIIRIVHFFTWKSENIFKIIHT